MSKNDAPAVSETDAATVARAIYKVLYPEFEDEGQCLAQMQALSDHMGMDVVACAHSAVAALASRPSPERREIVEECAKIAEAEELTGVPPIDWPLDKIEACEAAVRATAQSIAAAIRSLSEVRPKEEGDAPWSTIPKERLEQEVTRRAEAALREEFDAAPSPPAGEWQWVPKEPTNAMLEAGQAQGYRETWIYLTGESMRARWQRMLAAAPVESGESRE